MKFCYYIIRFNLFQYTVFTLLIALTIASCSSSKTTTSFGGKVRGLPQAYIYPNSGSLSTNIDKRTDLPWIVYSDRADNYTTTSPGGTLLMEKLNFLQPYYVSEERDGYVKLLKYKSNMIKGLDLKDKKSVESIGWINKQKLLLWSRSYTSKGTNYTNKAIVLPNSVLPLISPEIYFDDNDSILVYDTPDLKKSIGKVGLNEYAYIFKQTPNNEQYLIGTNDQFVLTEIGKCIKGWVASDVISSWGNKLYLAPNSFEDAIRDAAMQSVNVKFNLAPYLYTIDPLVDTSKIVQSALALGDEGGLYYPLPVYDKSNNHVTTINGAQLSYKEFLLLMKNRSKVNVVFVIDGGGSMRTRFASLINTIQSFEKTLYSYFKPKDLKFGSVIYRSKSNCGVGSSQLRLTNDYRNLTAFLKHQSDITSKCSAGYGNEPLFSGLEDAANLVADVPQQTNLFVVIGSVGDEYELLDYKISNVAHKLASVDGRLLIMQSYNESSNLFSNFIVQSRQLLTKEANLAAEKRKFQSVKGDAFSNQVYDFNILDSISFFLDFPKNSMIQGGVVFPSRRTSLNAKVYTEGFEKLLTDTKYDIEFHINSIRDAFRLTGVSNRNITSYVQVALGDKFNNQVGDNMPHNQFNFYNKQLYHSNNLNELYSFNLEYNLILNDREYKQFLEGLSILVGENLRGDDPQFRNKLYKNYSTLYYSVLGDKAKRRPVGKVRLNDYFESVLGIPIEPSVYSNLLIESFIKSKDLSNTDFEEYMKYLQSVLRKVKDFSSKEGKFFSNGEPYYRVKGSFFY